MANFFNAGEFTYTIIGDDFYIQQSDKTLRLATEEEIVIIRTTLAKSLNFGKNNTFGNLSFGDIAGGNIIKL